MTLAIAAALALPAGAATAEASMPPPIPPPPSPPPGPPPPSTPPSPEDFDWQALVNAWALDHPGPPPAYGVRVTPDVVYAR